MNHDTHKEFIERQKAMADEAGKAVAEKVLKGMDLSEIISNPKKARMRFLTTILKESDGHFNDTLKLGREFFALKFGGGENAGA